MEYGTCLYLCEFVFVTLFPDEARKRLFVDKVRVLCSHVLVYVKDAESFIVIDRLIVTTVTR